MRDPSPFLYHPDTIRHLLPTVLNPNLHDPELADTYIDIQRAWTKLPDKYKKAAWVRIVKGYQPRYLARTRGGTIMSWAKRYPIRDAHWACHAISVRLLGRQEYEWLITAHPPRDTKY